jgi:hypothetical protein
VNNQSESRVKLDSEDNATIQEEEVPLKKLEVTINRGHRQTKRRYRKRRERIIGQTLHSRFLIHFFSILIRLHIVVLREAGRFTCVLLLSHFSSLILSSGWIFYFDLKFR